MPCIVLVLSLSVCKYLKTTLIIRDNGRPDKSYAANQYSLYIAVHFIRSASFTLIAHR